MPIITRMGAGDLAVQGDIHLRYHAQSIRQRLVNANGHADNQVIVGNLAPSELLIDQMGQWLTAIKADTSRRWSRRRSWRTSPPTWSTPAGPPRA